MLHQPELRNGRCTRFGAWKLRAYDKPSDDVGDDGPETHTDQSIIGTCFERRHQRCQTERNQAPDLKAFKFIGLDGTPLERAQHKDLISAPFDLQPFCGLVFDDQPVGGRNDRRRRNRGGHGPV